MYSSSTANSTSSIPSFVNQRSQPRLHEVAGCSLQTLWFLWSGPSCNWPLWERPKPYVDRHQPVSFHLVFSCHCDWTLKAMKYFICKDVALPSKPYGKAFWLRLEAGHTGDRGLHMRFQKAIKKLASCSWVWLPNTLTTMPNSYPSLKV